MINFYKCSMSGIAQVIVQPCSLSGFIILVGIAVHSWKMAVGALIGTAIGTAVAVFLKYQFRNIWIQRHFDWHREYFSISNHSDFYNSFDYLLCLFCVGYQLDSVVPAPARFYSALCIYNLVSNSYFQ